MNNFRLIGHDCPLGAYPAPVVPIGELEGRLVAIYASSTGQGIVEIPQDAHFTVHDSDTKEYLKEFSHKTQRLFAYLANHIVAYKISEEQEFFARVLSDSLFGIHNPFLRLALAKGTRDASIVLRELTACAKSLNSFAPDLVPEWYERERNSAVEAGIDGNGLPPDATALLETPGLVSPRARDEVARLIRSVGGMNVVTRPDLPFDLYFEHGDRYGKVLRTAVQLKFHRRVDEDAIKELQYAYRMYKDQKIVDQTWLIFGGELTSRAAELANDLHIQLFTLTDLSRKAASMNAFECLFIDASYATVRVRPWIQLNPHSRDDLIRIFPAAELDPLLGVTLFAREYVGEILSAAENPSRCMLTFDLLGAHADFPDWHKSPLHQARLLANAKYADAFRRKFPDQSPGARRVLVVDPNCISKEGASNLRAYVLHHLRLGIGVAIMAEGLSRETAFVSRMAGFAREYENIWARSKTIGRTAQAYFYNNDLAIHWLWRETAQTAGQILADPSASHRVESESDVDRIFQILQIPKANFEQPK